MSLLPVAYYRGALTSKFGIPRQSSLSADLLGRIVFEPEFRDANAIRGLYGTVSDGFDHIWLIWGFSGNAGKGWSPTVRPPRLGGNARMGLWATRSPFRPNPLGLSCVKIEGIEGTDIIVSGADLMDMTPIYDIKPYVAYTDSIPDACSGFASDRPRPSLEVYFNGIKPPFGPRELKALEQILSLDPRPAYQDDPVREYAFPYSGHTICFRVEGNKLIITGIKDES